MFHLCQALKMLIFKEASSNMAQPLRKLQLIGRMVLLLQDGLQNSHRYEEDT